MSWDTWNHAQRFEFLHQLRQPHKELDSAIAATQKKWQEQGIDPRGPIHDSDTMAAVYQLEALVDAWILELKADIHAHETEIEERLAIRQEARCA